MMLETIIIVTVIALAASFAAWRAYSTLRIAKGGKACGGCEKCD